MKHLEVIARGRARAQERFTETFVAYTVDTVLDEQTGLLAEVEEVLHADIAGRLKSPTLNTSERAQGGQVSAVQDIEVHVGIGATPGVVVAAMWRVESSTVDLSLVGRKFRTKGLPQSGSTTAHRYPVESVA